VALVLYFGSSQIVLTAMTAFAMTAHLALDLVWLALFLRNSRISHLLAVLVGFLATGLHQPIFHPLFVAPFFLLLLEERRWRLLGFYAAGYAVVVTFWVLWPLWVSAHGTTAAAGSEHGVGAFARVVRTFIAPEVGSLWLMVLNLIRFVAWQHLLLLPLLLVGLRVAFCSRGLPRALAIGLLLPLPVMFLLQADQGIGWGYRYLAGVLGNACLLAAYGYHELTCNNISLRRPLIVSTIATFAILMPVRAVMASTFVDHWARIDRAIEKIGADVAIIDDGQLFTSNLVINQPDLLNRPVRLLASALSPNDIRILCKQWSLSFFDAAELQSLRNLLYSSPGHTSDHARVLENAMHRTDCRIVQPRSTQATKEDKRAAHAGNKKVL
jgi:hypothetical protein